MTRQPKKVTLDTSAVEPSVKNHAALLGYEVQVVTVTAREVAGTSFEVSVGEIQLVSEVAHWDESKWDQAVWGGPDTKQVEETALDIIASGGFPKNRAALTDKQRRQLRDAMILEAHVRSGADRFVTNDKKGFVSHGKREAFQEQLGVRVLLVSEFLARKPGAGRVPSR